MIKALIYLIMSCLDFQILEQWNENSNLQVSTTMSQLSSIKNNSAIHL